MTLTEFLLARIADREAVARDMQDQERLGRPFFRVDELAGGTGIRELIDPARILAECEAKRRIVKAVSGWQHETVEDCWYSCAATYGTDVDNSCCDDRRAGKGCDCGLEYRAKAILGPLALPDADHPDYDPEWAV